MKNNSKWSVAGASARGISHRKSNAPCQDAFSWISLNDEWVALAVADGAGSAEHSDIGARVAVQVATTSIREQCNAPGGDLFAGEETLRAMLQHTAQVTREAVVETARAMRRPARELASTLLVVVAGPTTTAALHIGDGAAVIETVDGGLVTLSKPDAGEFMGESTFLVSSEALAKARISFAPAAKSIALFSDGIQLLTLQYPGWEPFEPFFRQTFSFMGAVAAPDATRQLETFIGSDRLSTRTDDDITLVLASREVAVAVTAIAPEPMPLPVNVTPATTVAAATAAVTAAVAHPFTKILDFLR